MAYERMRDLPQVTEPICAHLRSKSMIVAGVANASDLDLRHHGHHGCWCNLTQHGRGPDSGAVDVTDCTPSRTCYSAIR